MTKVEERNQCCAQKLLLELDSSIKITTHSYCTRINPKSSTRHYGTYLVLNSSSRKHSIFHVPQLKKAVENHPVCHTRITCGFQADGLLGQINKKELVPWDKHSLHVTHRLAHEYCFVPHVRPLKRLRQKCETIYNQRIKTKVWIYRMK